MPIINRERFIHTFNDIAELLADVKMDMDISAAWGIWLGRDSMEGKEVVEEVVEREMGVTDKMDDGLDVYDT